MSTFSHTDWTVICNGTDNGTPCPQQYGPDGLAEHLRRRAKRAGWAVNVPNPDGSRTRLDFCPDHIPAPRETP